MDKRNRTADELMRTRQTLQSPHAFLENVGRVFAQFDERTQDSGNISYGVEVDGIRFFAKTAGLPASMTALTHDQRIFWLRNAVRVSGALRDPVLPRLLNVIESRDGPILVFEWASGELIGVPSERRTDPESPFQRFKSLPLDELVAALTAVFRVHARFCALGWVANDFYDGAMMYDFGRRRLSLVDLDMYRDAPFRNDIGRLFGSTRFMAPEEFERGATIDETTTVFTMGRCIQVFLGPHAARDGLGTTQSFLSVAERACRQEREDRWRSMREFYTSWLGATTRPSG